MRNFFYLSATTVLVQGVELGVQQKLEAIEAAISLHPISNLNFAQVSGSIRGDKRRRGRSTPSRRAKTNSPDFRDRRGRLDRRDSPDTPDRRQRDPLSDSSEDVLSPRPSRREQLSNKNIPDRRNRNTKIPERPQKNTLDNNTNSSKNNLSDDNTKRDTNKNNQQNGKINRSQSEDVSSDSTKLDRPLSKIETVEKVRSQSAPVSSRSAFTQAEPPAAIPQEKLSWADKLVIGTSVMELPAMIADVVMSAKQHEEDLELSREQFDKEHALAVEQNDAEAQERIRYQQELEEQKVADAKAEEIASIWRAQQKVQDDWALAEDEVVELNDQLYDVQQDLDFLENNCRDDPYQEGCEVLWNDETDLMNEENAIYDQFDVLSEKMDKLTDVSNQLIALENEFCKDPPADYLADCMAIV